MEVPESNNVTSTNTIQTEIKEIWTELRNHQQESKQQLTAVQNKLDQLENRVKRNEQVTRKYNSRIYGFLPPTNTTDLTTLTDHTTKCVYETLLKETLQTPKNIINEIITNDVKWITRTNTPYIHLHFPSVAMKNNFDRFVKKIPNTFKPNNKPVLLKDDITAHQNKLEQQTRRIALQLKSKIPGIAYRHESIRIEENGKPQWLHFKHPRI